MVSTTKPPHPSPSSDSFCAIPDSNSDVSQESPSNLPTPSSDVTENHPPSPSEDFTSYSQLVLRMAKSLQLDIEESPPQRQDLVFDDLN